MFPELNVSNFVRTSRRGYLQLPRVHVLRWDRKQKFVYGSSAISGEGLNEGLTEFGEAVKEYVETKT